MSNKRKVDWSARRMVDAAFTPEQAAAMVAASEMENLGDAVSVAFVHEHQIDFNFFFSMIQLIEHDLATSMRVARGGIIAERSTTGDLPSDRNRGVEDFLKDERQAEWLMWIDTDMGFEPDSIDRLAASADPVERPVMGGLCFGWREDEGDGAGGFRPVAVPVIFDWDVVEGREGFSVRWDYPRNSVTRCTGVGSAFVLIHRSVFERVQRRYAEATGNPDWAGWYTRIRSPMTGNLMGEDLSFCFRLMSLEIPVHVNTAVQTTHRKNIWVQEKDYWQQRALAPKPPETVQNLPPEERVVPRFAVVPTHNRPERLKALVAALAPQVDHIVVLDNASEPPVDRDELWGLTSEDTILEVVRDEEQPPNLARFWNVLFDHCAEVAKVDGADAWDVAVFNDDAIVPAGWFDICSTVLRGHDTAAVAHTGATPVHRHELLDAYPYPREKRMCPWAFVVKGELGLRADEQFKWWAQDDDFCRSAIDAGGVLAAPGPLVINANAVQSTARSQELAEQAQRDVEAFVAKWGETP